MTAQVQERITQANVDWAYETMIISADLVEIAIMERMPRHVIEQRRENLASATRHYEQISDMMLEQQYPFEPTLELQIEREL